MSTGESEVARRLAMISVCVVSVVVCCALAWWQWERYSSASGTWQNLGYVLQWPLFGLFPAFVFLRMRKLRRQSAAADDESDLGHDAPPSPSRATRVTPVADDTPDDTDDELAAYNRYLAELNARDGEQR